MSEVLDFPRTGATPAAPSPVLARPRPLPPNVSVLRRVLIGRENGVAAWGPDAFERPIMDLRTFRRHLIVLSDPAAIRHVLLDNVGNYVRDRIGRAVLKPGLGDGLLTAEGEVWKRHRRMMAPAFSPRRVDSFVPDIATLTEDAIADWARVGDGHAFDMNEAMVALTLKIIARIMFSADAENDARAIAEASATYQHLVRPGLADLFGLPGWVPRPTNRAGRRALRHMDALIHDLLARRDAMEDKGTDLLGLLVTARDEEGGPALDRRELRDQVATIMGAGHETTAHSMTWTFYLLALHPAEQARVAEEARAVLGDRAPEPADIPHLRRTRMVIEEAMRLYPPAYAFARQAVEPDVVGGVAVEPGATVFISPWLVHRHRTLWRDPERFDPENFAPEAVAARPRFAYLPFGGGPRICIGAQLAMTEAIIMLAMIARRFEVRLVPGQDIEPQGLITLRPRHGIRVLVHGRED